MMRDGNTRFFRVQMSTLMVFGPDGERLPERRFRGNHSLGVVCDDLLVAANMARATMESRGHAEIRVVSVQDMGAVDAIDLSGEPGPRR